MSSYEGWLKITWLLNVTLTGVCDCMYTQPDIRIFVWTVCVCVAGDLWQYCSVFIDGWNIEISFSFSLHSQIILPGQTIGTTLRVWMLTLDSRGKFL